MAGLAVAPFSARGQEDASGPAAARIAGLHELGAAFKNVNDELKSKEPSVFLIQAAARQIRATIRDMPFWFPPDSAPRPGIKTAAKPDIWQKPEEFKMAEDNFTAKATTFMGAVTAGDLPTIRTAAQELGETCKACHQKFRNEEKQ